MIQMKVTAQQAKQILQGQGIKHGTYQKGIQSRWHTYTGKNGKDQATAQSICWLFCWATTGQGSAKAMQAAKKAFDAIFDPPYSWLKKRPCFNVDKARQLRYGKGKNVECKFCSYII